MEARVFTRFRVAGGERNFTQMVGVGVRLKRREVGEIPRALEKEETQRGTS